MKKPFLIMIFILVFSAVLLTACGGGAEEPAESNVPAEYAGKTNPVADDANAIASGKVIYEEKCASCHGVSGKGDGPAGQALTPPAADLTKIAGQDDYEFYRIAEGGAMDPYNSSMPAHKGILSEDEIWQVIAYVDSLK